MVCRRGRKTNSVTSIATNSINIFYSDIWLLCPILSYISQQRSHALCDLMKIGARLTVKPGSYMTFMEVKALVKQTDIPAFQAFAFWFSPDFSTAQSQLPVHCLMCFNIWSTLAISSWKFPAWLSSWPSCLGWVPKEDFTIHASWLLNFTNTFFVDLKTFFSSNPQQCRQVIWQPGTCRSPGAQMCNSPFMVLCEILLLWSFSHLLATN